MDGALPTWTLPEPVPSSAPGTALGLRWAGTIARLVSGHTAHFHGPTRQRLCPPGARGNRPVPGWGGCCCSPCRPTPTPRRLAGASCSCQQGGGPRRGPANPARDPRRPERRRRQLRGSSRWPSSRLLPAGPLHDAPWDRASVWDREFGDGRRGRPHSDAQTQARGCVSVSDRHAEQEGLHRTFNGTCSTEHG